MHPNVDFRHGQRAARHDTDAADLDQSGEGSGRRSEQAPVRNKHLGAIIRYEP